jgi:hypothetical protein
MDGAPRLFGGDGVGHLPPNFCGGDGVGYPTTRLG